MKVRKEWIGSKKPASQGDLADVQEDIHADLSELTQNVKKIEQNMATKEDLKGVMTKETGEELLNVMKSIDKRLKKQEDIPARITAVENDVFKLKLRR